MIWNFLLPENEKDLSFNSIFDSHQPSHTLCPHTKVGILKSCMVCDHESLQWPQYGPVHEWIWQISRVYTRTEAHTKRNDREIDRQTDRQTGGPRCHVALRQMPALWLFRWQIAWLVDSDRTSTVVHTIRLPSGLWNCSYDVIRYGLRRYVRLKSD